MRSRHIAWSGHRHLAALECAILLVATSAPVFADYVVIAPSSSQAVDEQNDGLRVRYVPWTDADVGAGQQFILFDTIVNRTLFDLSHVPGTITSLELRGSIPSLHWAFAGAWGTDPPNPYATLSVNITLPTTLNPPDLQSFFASVMNGGVAGGFRVDNTYLPTQPPPAFGPNFDVLLDPSAISAIQNGTLALGFAPVLFVHDFPSFPLNPGITGFLSDELIVQFVPEPGSLSLIVLGAVVLGFGRFRRTSRIIENN
jgi:hypothetical protein